MKVVISGSFRKHLNEILNLKNKLESDGIEVLKPTYFETIDNPKNPEFIKFEGEEEKSEESLQIEYDNAIFLCDAHIICNIDGYLGNSTIRELLLGSGNNSYTEKEKQKGIFKSNNSQVYLLEPWNEVGFETKESTEHFSCFLNYLIQKGNIKIGLKQMYKDFNIVNKECER